MVANMSSVNAYANNMYGLSFGPSMANDYFGSQVFGNNSMNVQSSGPVFTKAPNDLASYLIQQHAAANNVTVQSQPTWQNYAMATQIADMYTSNIPPLFSGTSFMQNDIFAQQAMPNLYYCG